jgi:hypothetical protein
MSKQPTVYGKGPDLLSTVEVTVGVDYPDVRIVLKSTRDGNVACLLHPTAARLIAGQLNAVALQVEMANEKKGVKG